MLLGPWLQREESRRHVLRLTDRVGEPQYAVQDRHISLLMMGRGHPSQTDIYDPFRLRVSRARDISSHSAFTRLFTCIAFGISCGTSTSAQYTMADVYEPIMIS